MATGLHENRDNRTIRANMPDMAVLRRSRFLEWATRRFYDPELSVENNLTSKSAIRYEWQPINVAFN